MFVRKLLVITLSALIVLSPVLGGTVQASAQKAQESVVESKSEAMPADPQDLSKVPHYFGPWPNWANSPFTLPNATVTIEGDGTGAEAVAVVDPETQGIASIQVTSPGAGYTSATVVIRGGNGN